MEDGRKTIANCMNSIIKKIRIRELKINQYE